MNKKYHTPTLLPSDDVLLKKYILKNERSLIEKVLASIEYALKENVDSICVFKFKDSDFVIFLPRQVFKQNIENIYRICVTKKYNDLCSRIKMVNIKLR